MEEVNKIYDVTPYQEFVKKSHVEKHDERIEKEQFTEKEMLQFLSAQGIVDLTLVKSFMAMQKEKEYLSMHHSKIWQRQDGVWVTYIGTGRKARKRITRNSKKAIEEYVIEYYRTLVEDPTFQMVFDSWIAEKLAREDILRQSADRYTNIFIKYIVNCQSVKNFSEQKIRLVTIDDLNKLLYPLMANKAVRRKDFSNLQTILRGVFRKAVREHYSDLDIIAYLNSIEKPRKGFRDTKKLPEEESFSDEEQELIRALLLENHDVRSLGLFIIFETGIRVGELSGLKKADVDGDVIYIRRTEAHFKDPQTKKNSVIVEEFTKTEAGNRNVIVSAVGRQVLEELLQMNPESEWLFSENGNRIRECGFRHKLTRVCDTLGIPCRSPHKIRKTYATSLMYSGVNEEVIKYVLGHTDIMTTRRSYVIPKTNVSFIRGELFKTQGAG